MMRNGYYDEKDLLNRLKNDDADAYITFVNRRAEAIQRKKAHQLLNLI